MNLAERVEALRAAPLFSKLPLPSVEQVAGRAALVELPEGSVLIEPGMKGSGMFVIVEGTVVVERRHSRFEYGPGEVVGELALLTDDEARTARVRAKTPVSCVAISRADFRDLLVTEPGLALAMLEIVADRLAERD